MIGIVPARDWHAEALAANLRPEDRSTIELLGGDVKGNVLESFASAREAFAIMDDEQPLVLFGVRDTGSLLAPIGWPWLFSTPAALPHKTALARIGRRMIRIWRLNYWRMEGVVDGQRREALRFAAWLGFKVGEGQHAEGGVFHPIAWERSWTR